MQFPYLPDCNSFDYERIFAAVKPDIDRYLDHIKPAEVQTLKGNKYELTLTIPDNSEENIAYIFERIDIIVKSKMFSIFDYVYALELNKKGVLHIHALLITNRKIQISRIKKIYKFVFHLSVIGDLNAYIQYIQKSSEDIELIKFLKNRNLHHIYRNPKCQIQLTNESIKKVQKLTQ